MGINRDQSENYLDLFVLKLLKDKQENKPHSFFTNYTNDSYYTTKADQTYQLTH